MIGHVCWSRWDIVVDTSSAHHFLKGKALSVLVPNPRTLSSRSETIGDLKSALRKLLDAPSLELNLSLRKCEHASGASGEEAAPTDLQDSVLLIHCSDLLRPDAVLMLSTGPDFQGGMMQVN